MPGMHFGSLREETKAGQIFELLRSLEGRWVDAGEIAGKVGTTCLSTHVSAVRHNLARRPELGFSIEHKEDVHGRRRWQYYRVVRAGEQLELIA